VSIQQYLRAVLRARTTTKPTFISGHPELVRNQSLWEMTSNEC